MPVVAALTSGYIVGVAGHQPIPPAGTISAKADIAANRGTMPVFSDRTLDPDQKRQIIAYLNELRRAAGNPGR